MGPSQEITLPALDPHSLASPRSAPARSSGTISLMPIGQLRIIAEIPDDLRSIGIT